MNFRDRLPERLGDSWKDLQAGILELLFERRAQVGHPSPADAIEIGFQMILSTLDQAVLFDEIGRRGMRLDNPRLAGELARMYLGYLNVEP